jgi:2-aminoethylphosphonate transport system permease protein
MSTNKNEGLVIALILAFVPFPGARELARLIDAFIALPTFLLTLAFTLSTVRPAC